MRSGPIIKLLIACCFLFQFVKGISQPATDSKSNYGLHAGLVLAYGTHFQRIGFNIHFFYSYASLQLNSEIRVYRSFRNLGPKSVYNELVLSQGIVYGYGHKEGEINPFVSSVSNQTAYDHSVAYSFNAYFNKIGTLQQTGSLAFQFNELNVICENDLLGRPQLDRFRTGAFLIMYQYQNLHQFALNCSMWTGQMGNRVETPESEFFSHCYMDSTGGKFTNCSHGLLSFQFKSVLPYNQSVQANAGIDAEQIRNLVQNKIIHDMVFLPKRWRPGNNCHIPMLDANRNAYLYKKEQVIKPASLYLNVFSNAAVFY